MAAWQRMEYPRDKGACYRLLGGQLSALMEGERDALANLANASALIYQALPDLNWAGFYLYKQGMLVLGPFQGMPACVRIPLARGVCGAAARTGEVQLVPDVDAFPGHIACASSTRSELVIPVFGTGGRLIGVLDIDSDQPDAFSAADADALVGILKDVFGKL